MARKRKTRSSGPSQEPDTVQTEQPEPETQQPDPEQTEQEQTLPDEPETEAVVENVENEEEQEQEQDGEEEEQHEQLENMEGDQTDAVAEKAEPESEMTAVAEKAEPESEMTKKPLPESAISANGAADGVAEKGQEEELEDEPLEKLLEPFTKDQLTVLIKEAVSVHPNFIENVRKMADTDPSHRKIFVHGLGWDANTETITSVFGKYGEIEDCKVVSDRNSGKSKGYGFILFKHRDGARHALKEPQKKIGNRMTSCQLASAGPVQVPPPAAPAPSFSAPSTSDYTQRKIFVSNVSAELDPKKLLEFFSRYGEIEEGPLGLDKQTGKPRGFCLFVYKSLESAKKALEEPHKNFEGVTLHCQKAVDGPKHSKGGGGGYYNQDVQQPSYRQQQQQGYYQHTAKKGRHGGGVGGHLMAPSAGPQAGFNPAIGQIGQAVATLLATQGGGLGMGNMMGGVSPQGVMMPLMNNAGYGAQGGGYGGQPMMHGGYGQPQMGQGGVRPHQGGGPYMGHGH